MIRKITVIVASGDADTQWRRIRKPVAADVRWICNPPKNEYMNL